MISHYAGLYKETAYKFNLKCSITNHFPWLWIEAHLSISKKNKNNKKKNVHLLHGVLMMSSDLLADKGIRTLDGFTKIRKNISANVSESILYIFLQGYPAAS